MIRVDHTGVPARTRLEAAGFLASLFGLDREIPDDSRFTPVRVNSEFTIDLFDSEHIEPMHVAFVVDDAAFDGILKRLQAQGRAFLLRPRRRRRSVCPASSSAVSSGRCST
jgi:catechol 2,3-dioxygenase-like lactoylglutathione lyase family enzyme